MAHIKAQLSHFKTLRGSLGVLAAMGCAVMLSACSSTSELLQSPQASLSTPDDPNDPNNELRRATEYWGKRYAAKPADKTAALSYARNLKAGGEKRQALSVMQDAFAAHPNDVEVAGEFGRLALEFDQLTAAARALEIASNTGEPDWKVLSARGTLLAKQGQHKAAIPYFEHALKISPNQPSVMNNLAMATAMSGDAKKAEEILRTASSTGGASPLVNQNLALVLSLQGKYDEAKNTGARTAPAEVAAANTDYVRRMVRLEPQASPAGVPAFQTAVAPAAKAGPASKVAASAAPVAGFKQTTIDTASAATGTSGWQTNVASTEPAH